MAKPKAPKVDLKDFKRQLFAQRSSQLGQVLNRLESHVHSLVSHNTDPRHVPFHHLWEMGTHPMIYLAERTILGIVRRPDLFTVEHSDDKIKAETEEWLWPLMQRGLLSAAARAFAYGNIPVVFNWTRETLRYQVPGKDGTPANRTRKGYAFYKSVHDLVPYPHTNVIYEGDELVEIHQGQQKFGKDRAHHFIWDREFGDRVGQSARRRAWRDYTTSQIIEILQATYLERSVDAPRIGFAPPGTVDTGDADAQPISEAMLELMMGQRGSGACVFPSTRNENGDLLYSMEILDLPDRDEVWLRALQRYDSRILISYLSSPALAGIDDMAAAASRSLEGMLKEFTQDIADWIATELTDIVSNVHRANNPDSVEPPTIIATDVGKAAAMKTLLEVTRMAEDRVALNLDVGKALDRLGAPVLDVELDPEPVAAPPGPDGRPQDMTGDREERRERGQTDNAEDATGAKDEEASGSLPNFSA